MPDRGVGGTGRVLALTARRKVPLQNRLDEHDRETQQRLLRSSDLLSWVDDQILQLLMQHIECLLEDQLKKAVLKGGLCPVMKVPGQSDATGFSSARKLVHKCMRQRERNTLFLFAQRQQVQDVVVNDILLLYGGFQPTALGDHRNSLVDLLGHIGDQFWVVKVVAD